MTASTCVLVETGDEDPLVSVATLVDGLVGDASGKIAKECAALQVRTFGTRLMMKLVNPPLGGAVKFAVKVALLALLLQLGLRLRGLRLDIRVVPH